MKKILSLVLSLALALQFICIVHAEGATLTLQGVTRDGGSITVNFSEIPTLDKVQIVDANYQIVSCQNAVSDKSVVISTSSLINGNYFLRILLDEPEIYSFNVNKSSVTSDFNTDDDCRRWTAVLDVDTYSRTGYIKSNGAGGAFLADNASNIATGSFNRVNRAADVYLNDYTNYLNYTDSTLEFDYSNSDTAQALEGAETGSVFRAFFRAGQISVTTTTFPVVSSANGAYVIEIYKKGKGIHLAKWNGTGARFTNLSAKENVTTLADNALLVYNRGDVYKYVINSTNVENGVNIVVKRALYTNSVLGAYETVFNYTDTATPLYSGSFWMSARTSDSMGNYNAHVIDNVVFSTYDKTITNMNVNNMSQEISSKIDELMQTTDLYKYETEIEAVAADIDVLENLVGVDLTQIKEKYNQLIAAKYESLKTAVQASIESIYNNYDWKSCADEIASIGGEITVLNNAGYTLDVGYQTKYDEILAGRTNTQLSQSLFNKLSTQNQITVVFLGGSLTEGGGTYQAMFKTYLAEKTGVSESNITIINAGNGGTGSDWHITRLYDDCAKYNPDIVCIDINANDTTALIAGELRTLTYVETIIRRLQKLEKKPAIAYIQLFTNDCLKKRLLQVKGISHYLTNSVVKEISSSPQDLHDEIIQKYNLANISILDNYVQYTSLDNPLTQAVDESAVEFAYYKKTGTNSWTECTASDEGAIKTLITPIDNVMPYVDFDKFNGEFNTNFSFGSVTVNNVVYNYPAYICTTADGTHPNANGYAMWGKLMMKILDAVPDCALRIQETSSEKPLMAYTYDQFNPKSIKISVENIDSMDCFTVDTSNGGSYTNETGVYTNRGRSGKTGVKFTGPITFEFKFKGNVFDMTYRSIHENAVKSYVTIDGGAYACAKPYIGARMLSGDTEHVFKVELPASEVLIISELFVDENTIMNGFKENGKFVTVDLFNVANMYGAYGDGDGNVFSGSDVLYKNGKEPDIKVSYLEDSYYNYSPDANEIYNYINSSGYTGTPFNVDQMLHSRYKAVSPSKLLKGEKINQSYNSCVYDANSNIANTTVVDLPDDFYSELYLLEYSKSNYTGSMIRVYFTDGTNTDIIYNIYKSGMAITDQNAKIVTKIHERSNLGGDKQISQVDLTEYTLAVPTDKRIDKIALMSTDNLDEIFGITMKKVFDGGLFKVEYTDANGNAIYDLAGHQGEIVEAQFFVGSDVADAMLAIYDSNNKMIKVVKADTAASDQYINVTKAAFTVPALANGYHTKVFLWNQSELVPLTKTIN